MHRGGDREERKKERTRKKERERAMSCPCFSDSSFLTVISSFPVGLPPSVPRDTLPSGSQLHSAWLQVEIFQNCPSSLWSADSSVMDTSNMSLSVIMVCEQSVLICTSGMLT